MNEIDGMACAKPGRDNRGKLGLNIVGHGSFATKWGRRRRYRCTVCGGTVSTNTGTAYSGLRCARREFDQVVEPARRGCEYFRDRPRRGHVDLLRCYYNFIRPHRALKFGRETRTPPMQAGLVSGPMNWIDIFTAPAALYAFLVAVVRVPVAVQLTETSPAALSTFSWPHEHRSAA